jgi:uncharacterized protein YaiE (UPF0345 family)
MEFKNVTVLAKANVYEDGKVTSRTLLFPDGSKKTLGVMMPGRYRFNTSASELMEILGGRARVLVKGANDWAEVGAGGSFNVPADSHFEIAVAELLDYCCSYSV